MLLGVVKLNFIFQRAIVNSESAETVCLKRLQDSAPQNHLRFWLRDTTADEHGGGTGGGSHFVVVSSSSSSSAATRLVITTAAAAAAAAAGIRLFDDWVPHFIQRPPLHLRPRSRDKKRRENFVKVRGYLDLICSGFLALHAQPAADSLQNFSRLSLNRTGHRVRSLQLSDKKAREIIKKKEANNHLGILVQTFAD